MFTVQQIRSTAPSTKALSGLLSRPDLVERFPLILTCAKHTLFCESQHRALPRLRRQALDPEVELHPSAASERGISPSDWVHIETPALVNGAVGAVAQRGRQSLVFSLTIKSGKIVEINVVADPEHLRHLDLVILGPS